MILFSTAVNLLVTSVEKLRQRVIHTSNVQQAPIRAFTDDLTITARSVLEGRWLLEDLVEITKEVRMEFKPLKSGSLVLMRGHFQDWF